MYFFLNKLIVLKAAFFYLQLEKHSFFMHQRILKKLNIK